MLRHIVTFTSSLLALAGLMLLSGCEDSDNKINLNFTNMVEEVVVTQGTTIETLEVDSGQLADLRLTLGGEEITFNQDDMRFQLLGRLITSSNIVIEVIDGDSDVVDVNAFSIVGPVLDDDGNNIYGIVVDEYTFDTPGTATIRLSVDTSFATGEAVFDFTVEPSTESISASF